MAEAKQTSSSMGWVVVLAGLGINLCLGVLYTWSMFTAALTGKWGWTAAQALTPYAIALGMFALTMVFAGRLQDRIGPRIAASIGGVLVGLGMIVASFAPKPPAAMVADFAKYKPISDKATAALAKVPPAAVPAEWTAQAEATFKAAKLGLAPFVGPQLPWLIVGFGILTGAGIGFAYAAATPAAVKWFSPTKKGLISGIVVAGFGMASLYTAPLTGNMLANSSLGVNGTMFWLGIAFLIAIIIFAQLLRNPPAGYVPAADTNAPAGANAPKAAHRDYTWQEMIKTPQFWMMWVMYAFAAGAGLMVVGIIAKFALGIPDVAAQMNAITDGFKGGPNDWIAKAGATFTVVMALALGNGAGRPITGWISDRIGRTRTMMAVFIFQAFLMVAMTFINSFGLLLVLAAFIGFMYGANLTLFPAMTFDFFGTKNGGVNYGLVFTAWGLGGVLGSIGAGFAKDYFGSFNNAFFVAAGLLVIATVIAAVIRPPVAVPAAELHNDTMLAEGA